MGFKNKVVLVIGGSSGIGEATALLFSKAGAHVAIVGRNETKLKAVAEKFSGEKPLIIKADISKDKEVETIVEKTIKKFGKLDILINNAGILYSGSLMDRSIMKTYDDVMNVNLRGIVNITSLAAPHLAESKGNIINVSSVLGSVPTKIPGAIMYSVSKAALLQFTQVAAIETAAHGVRVNAISPGPVHTDLISSANQYLPPDFEEQVKQSTALKRVSSADEIGDAMLFLASEKSKSITGANFLVDNGYFLAQ